MLRVEPGAKCGKYRIGQLLIDGETKQTRFAMDTTEDGRQIVVKMLERKLTSNVETASDLADHEISTMKQLDHGSCLKFSEKFDCDSYVCVVAEAPFNGGKTLSEYIDGPNKGWIAKNAGGLFAQVLDIIKYFHSIGVCHGSIRPESILVNEDVTRIAVFDFGSAQRIDRDDQALRDWPRESRATNTPKSSEECLQHTSPDSRRAIDVWGAGVTLLRMTTGMAVNDDERGEAHRTDSASKKPHIPDSLSVQLQDLLHGMLQPDPAQRLSLQEVVSHSWLLAGGGQPSERSCGEHDNPCAMKDSPRAGARSSLPPLRVGNEVQCQTKTTNSDPKSGSSHVGAVSASDSATEPSSRRKMHFLHLTSHGPSKSAAERSHKPSRSFKRRASFMDEMKNITQDKTSPIRPPRQPIKRSISMIDERTSPPESQITLRSIINSSRSWAWEPPGADGQMVNAPVIQYSLSSVETAHLSPPPEGVGSPPPVVTGKGYAEVGADLSASRSQGRNGDSRSSERVSSPCNEVGKLPKENAVEILHREHLPHKDHVCSSSVEPDERLGPAVKENDEKEEGAGYEGVLGVNERVMDDDAASRANSPVVPRAYGAGSTEEMARAGVTWPTRSRPLREMVESCADKDNIWGFAPKLEAEKGPTSYPRKDTVDNVIEGAFCSVAGVVGVGQKVGYSEKNADIQTKRTSKLVRWLRRKRMPRTSSYPCDVVGGGVDDSSGVKDLVCTSDEDRKRTKRKKGFVRNLAKLVGF